MRCVGYARVSTRGQTLEAQEASLNSHGCVKIFKETISGIKKLEDRTALIKALQSLKSGDVLMVTRLDRLARSTLELLKILDIIKDAGATFKSVNDPWIDTSTPTGKLLLTVLGGLAEFERSLIVERTADGRARAKTQGVKFGPKFLLSPDKVEAAKGMLASGKSYKAVAAVLDVSHMTVRRATAPTA